MKIWSIVTDEREYELEVSNSTQLYGQHLLWHQLIRQIDNFFNTRNSSVEIFEGSLPINKKDWKCFIIPYDAEVQLTKITANSPLKDLQSDVTEHLSYSPLFQELLEVWNQLDGELEFINQHLKKWGIYAKLNTINENEFSKYVTFQAQSGKNLSPLDVKMLLINIILEKELEKKTLIIIELPELYAFDEDLKKFNQIIKKASEKGYQFMIVSTKQNYGIENYYYKDKIIHSALLEQLKNKVIRELPFYCSDELYEKGKDIFLKLVDNSISEEDIFQFCKDDFGTIVTIIHVIMYNLDIDPIQVPQGIEPNLKRFISDLN